MRIFHSPRGYAPAGVYPWISFPNSLSLSSHYLQVVPTNTSTVLFGPQKANVKIILVTWSSTAKRAARSAKVFGSLNWSVFDLICICWRGSWFADTSQRGQFIHFYIRTKSIRTLWLVNQLWFIVPVNPWKNRASSELLHKSNRPQVSMVYMLINYLRSWVTRTHSCRHKCFPVCAPQERSWATMCPQQCVLVYQGL